MKKLIFEKPSLSPLPHRIGWTFFTTLFWMIWIYLWLPLITLGLWWLGFDFYDKHFLEISLAEWTSIKNLAIVYVCIVIFLGGSLLAWARTEFLRFRHVRRRLRPAPVEVAELAALALKVSVKKMTELSSARRIIAHHDEHGKFLDAELLEN